MDLHRTRLSHESVRHEEVSNAVGQIHDRLAHHHGELERVHSSLVAIPPDEYIPPTYTRKHHIWARYLQSQFRGWRARRWASRMHLRNSNYLTLRVKEQSLRTKDEVSSLQQSIVDFIAPSPASSLASIAYSDLFSDSEEEDDKIPVAAIGLEFADPSNDIGPTGLCNLVGCLENDESSCQINLTSLDLSGSHVTGSLGGSSIAADLDIDLSGLRALCSCQSFCGNATVLHGRPACLLSRLCLTNSALGYAGLDLLLVTVGRSLSVLELGWNHFGDRGVERLAELLGGSQALEEIRMPGCGLGPNAASALSQLLCHAEGSRLRILDLAENWLAGLDFTARGACDSSGLAALGSALASLSIGRRGDGQAVAKGSALTDLDLRKNSLTTQAVKAFASGLGTCVGLRRLDLSCNRLGDSGLAELAPALRLLTTSAGSSGNGKGLTLLNLAHNWLYAHSATLLSEALRDALDLYELDLSDNFIGKGSLDEASEAIGSLAETLRQLVSKGGQLRYLGLRGCRIDAASTDAFCVALPSVGKVHEDGMQSGLTEVDLSGNWLLSGGNSREQAEEQQATIFTGSLVLSGWLRLCGSLRHSLITHCALVDCQLDASAMVVLADNMAGWSSLRSLDLSRNPLGDDGVAALCGRLYVDVIQARGVPSQMRTYLADGHQTGTASTNLRLRCDGGTQTAQSRTSYHTLAPAWRDKFMFDGLGDSTDLEMTLVHWADDGSAVELGSVALASLSAKTIPALQPKETEQQAVTDGAGLSLPRWYPFFLPEHAEEPPAVGSANHALQRSSAKTVTFDLAAASSTSVGMLSDPDGKPQLLFENGRSATPADGNLQRQQQQFEVQCRLHFVGSGLRETRSLHTLRLCSCSLGPRGARSLSRAVGPTLRRLELDNNFLSGSELEEEPKASAQAVQSSAVVVSQVPCVQHHHHQHHHHHHQQQQQQEDHDDDDDEHESAGADEGQQTIVAAADQELSISSEKQSSIFAPKAVSLDWSQSSEAEKANASRPQDLPWPRWRRDGDLTGLVALARRLREQHAESGMAMQLTANGNQLGAAAESLLSIFMRSAEQALATTSWLERRLRERCAKAAVVAEAERSLR